MSIEKEQSPQNENKNTQSRRTMLKALAGIPIVGLFAYELMRKNSYDKTNDVRLIKDLGLENLQTAKQVPPVSQGELLRLGFVGFGNRAEQLASGLGYMHPSATENIGKNKRLNDWLAQENLNVAITGICDVFDLHAENGLATAKNEIQAGGAKPSGLPVKRYRTYQEMLADDSIDAIVVATPDHHHARITIDAIKAGKHVYCEKSVSHTEAELNELYEVVRNSDRVFQLGHQVTQSAVHQQAKEIIKKDILGKITLIEATTNRNSASGAWIRHVDKDGKLKPGDTSTIDWDQWLGQSPKVPFTTDRYYNWTKFFAYDTGMLGQLFTHEFDAVNQLLHIGIPKSAVASGGIYYWKDNREIPDSLTAVFEYPEHDLTLMYSANLASSRSRGRVFMGHDAAMDMSDTLVITADYDSTKYKEQIEKGLIDTRNPMLTINPRSGTIDAVSTATEKYYASRGLTSTVVNGRSVDVTHLHLKDWINCIRTGGVPSCNIEMAFEEGITVLMAHISYLEKRRVEWDPIQRKIV